MSLYASCVRERWQEGGIRVTLHGHGLVRGHEGTQGRFIYITAPDVTTRVLYTRPDRANQAASGTSVANDKQDKLFPL